MKRQLKTICDSSTTSLKSENLDIKADPVYFADKLRGNSNQFSEDSYRNTVFQAPQDGYRNSQEIKVGAETNAT